MMHELKCWPVHFEDVVSKGKRFEIRVDDRGFAPGDGVFLREFSPCSIRGSEGILGQDDSRYTGREWVGRITYVLRSADGVPGLKPGYCVFGME
jgi:hypothetical protein